VNNGPLVSCIQDFSNGNVSKNKRLPPTPCVENISNLNSITNASKFIMKCEILGLKRNFQRTCFEYVFSKAYQYCTNDEKVYRDLKYVFIKFVKANLLKCITWKLKCNKV
jgi:hypothetical protein